MRSEREKEKEAKVREREREKMRKTETNQRHEREKINKIINRRATITVHICMVTVAIMHKCTILHPLMWVFFEPKCVK